MAVEPKSRCHPGCLVRDCRPDTLTNPEGQIGTLQSESDVAPRIEVVSPVGHRVHEAEP